MTRKLQRSEHRKARLNIVLDAGLKVFIQDYAKRHHTQVTQIIINHFLDLYDREVDIDVEQI